MSVFQKNKDSESCDDDFINLCLELQRKCPHYINKEILESLFLCIFDFIKTFRNENDDSILKISQIEELFKSFNYKMKTHYLELLFDEMSKINEDTIINKKKLNIHK
jgi:hypothetical protein